MDIDARVELEAFHRFLEQQLSDGGSLSPEECLDLWRASIRSMGKPGKTSTP